MRSQASAHKSARVSGNQTEVWTRSLCLLVASKDGGQSRVSFYSFFFPPVTRLSNFSFKCSAM